jgi:hypothetical protein
MRSVKEDPSNARQLIKRAFKVDELAYLDQQPRFQQAFSVLRSYDDFEETVKVGVWLLDEHVEMLRAGQSRRPSTNGYSQFPLPLLA